MSCEDVAPVAVVEQLWKLHRIPPLLLWETRHRNWSDHFRSLHFQQLHSTYARCESSGSRQAVQCCPLLKGVCEHVAQTFWGTWTLAASRSSAGALCRRPGFNFCCLLFCCKPSAVNPCLQNLLQKELGLRHTHLHVHTSSGPHCTSNTNTKANI